MICAGTRYSGVYYYVTLRSPLAVRLPKILPEGGPLAHHTSTRYFVLCWLRGSSPLLLILSVVLALSVRYEIESTLIHTVCISRFENTPRVENTQ